MGKLGKGRQGRVAYKTLCRASASSETGPSHMTSRSWQASFHTHKKKNHTVGKQVENGPAHAGHKMLCMAPTSAGTGTPHMTSGTCYFPRYMPFPTVLLIPFPSKCIVPHTVGKWGSTTGRRRRAMATLLSSSTCTALL